jgi:hypothetical protein
MRQGLRRTGAFLLWALALAALPTAAHSQTDIATAGQTLRTRLGAATSLANAPLLSNADAALVRTVFDPAAVRRMPLDLPTVSATCIAIGEGITAYAEFANRLGGSEAMIKLQDEVSLGAAAGNLCVQRSFHAVSDAASAMPAASRSGIAPALQQMRTGAEQTIIGTLNASLDPAVNATNRAAMLAAILEDAPVVAASFPAAERQKLYQQIVALQPRALPADRKAFAAIAAAFAAPACNLLCGIAGGN